MRFDAKAADRDTASAKIRSRDGTVLPTPTPKPIAEGLLNRMAAASICLAMIVAPGCSGSRANPPGGSRPARDLVVHRGDFVQRFLVTGELEAVRSTYLSVPRVPNWETTIRWMEADGASVKSGAKVVEFDNASFARDLEDKHLEADRLRADMDRKKAELASQQSEQEFQVESRRIALDKAAKEAAVPIELVSRRDYQDKQLALEKAKVDHQKAIETFDAAKAAGEAELEQRRIAIAILEDQVRVARKAIDDLVITAPRDGIFVVADHPWEGRKLQIGDTVWVGLAVASLPELDAMRVSIDLSDVDDGRIGPGMAAICRLDTYPEASFRGSVSEITAVAQEPQQGRSLRRTFSGAVQLEDVDAARMRPGMSVKVEVEAARRPSVLLAPREGLDLSGPEAKARLASGSDVPIQLGPCNALDCVVEGGLEDGARLRHRG